MHAPLPTLFLIPAHREDIASLVEREIRTGKTNFLVCAEFNARKLFALEMLQTQVGEEHITQINLGHISYFSQKLSTARDFLRVFAETES